MTDCIEAIRLSAPERYSHLGKPGLRGSVIATVICSREYLLTRSEDEGRRTWTGGLHEPLLTISTLPCGNRASCTVSAVRRSRSSRRPGIIRPAGPRAGPHRSGCLVTGCDASAFSRPPGPRTGSGAAELRITSVSRALLAGFKVRASFMFAGCCWWQSLAVDGRSGASRGHARNASAGPRPRSWRAAPLPHRTDCCRSIRWREGVKGGFACTLTGRFHLCLLSCGHSRP
jgi:hypothetical protein